MNMRQKLLLTIIACIMAFLQVIPANGQDIPSTIKEAYALIDNEEYNNGYKLVKDIENKQVEVYGDSMIMMLNYEKGICLYNFNRYEEAIPCLNDALLCMEKFPHKDCSFLELIYGIGSCYYHLEQYEKAEEYFRRVIIRGRTQDFACTITTQALSELTDVYNKLGNNKLADQCLYSIYLEYRNVNKINWRRGLKELMDLADSYKILNKQDDEIECYRTILNIIASNAGKSDEDYFLYSTILAMKLNLYNRTGEAFSVYEQLIDISKELKENNQYVCQAYEECLHIKSLENDTAYIKDLLPSAIKYIKKTPKSEYNWTQHNLYEIIGNNLCYIGNSSLGIKYLEKKWNGKTPHDMLSIINLGNAYMESTPKKSLSYYLEAEKLINDSTDYPQKKNIYKAIRFLYSNMQKYKEAMLYDNVLAPLIKDNDSYDAYSSHLVYWALDLLNAGQKEKSILKFDEIKPFISRLSTKTLILYYSQLGFSNIKTENPSEAINALKRAIDLSISEYGNNNQWLVTIYHNLGRAYMLQKKYSNALSWLNKSKDLQIRLNGAAMQRTLDYIKECEEK